MFILVAQLHLDFKLKLVRSGQHELAFITDATSSLRPPGQASDMFFIPRVRPEAVKQKPKTPESNFRTFQASVSDFEVIDKIIDLIDHPCFQTFGPPKPDRDSIPYSIMGTLNHALSDIAIMRLRKPKKDFTIFEVRKYFPTTKENHRQKMCQLLNRHTSPNLYQSIMGTWIDYRDSHRYHDSPYFSASELKDMWLDPKVEQAASQLATSWINQKDLDLTDPQKFPQFEVGINCNFFLGNYIDDLPDSPYRLRFQLKTNIDAILLLANPDVPFCVDVIDFKTGQPDPVKMQVYLTKLAALSYRSIFHLNSTDEVPSYQERQIIPGAAHDTSDLCFVNFSYNSFLQEGTDGNFLRTPVGVDSDTVRRFEQTVDKIAHPKNKQFIHDQLTSYKGRCQKLPTFDC